MNLQSCGRPHALMLFIVTACMADISVAAEPAFDPLLARSPPRVERASIELLPKATPVGNAKLRVQFIDRPAKTSVVIDGGRGPAALRDDGLPPDEKRGDGVYTAIVNLNVEQFIRERSRRIQLAGKATTLPMFDQRELRGAMRFEPSTNLKLVPGVVDAIDKFWGFPLVVRPERELMIRDISVVSDPTRTFEPCTGTGTPMGAWTFGRLMTEIANWPATGIEPAAMVEHWVEQWKADRNINGFTAPARAIGAQRLLDMWPRLPDGRLDLGLAPFRLLAIVNRQDLRGNTLYGGGGAGEARLVFAAVKCGPDPVTSPPLPEAMPFTVIFEYGVPRTGCFAVRDWALQWHALGSLVPGSVTYNTALQAITDQFTLRDANPAKLPNRSAVNQVRTNEFALATTPADIFWELRESKLQSSGPWLGWLEHATIAQTPDLSLRSTPRLRDYINGNEAAILAGHHEVPLQYPAGSPLLGGFGYVGAGVSWNAAGILNLQARHKFSLATCNACHTLETGTHVLHIAPRAIGAEAALSNFLTGAGMPVTDPVSGVPRTFHDLLDRQMKLDQTAHMSCARKFDVALEELFFQPLQPAFSH